MLSFGVDLMLQDLEEFQFAVAVSEAVTLQEDTIYRCGQEQQQGKIEVLVSPVTNRRASLSNATGGKKEEEMHTQVTACCFCYSAVVRLMQFLCYCFLPAD